MIAASVAGPSGRWPGAGGNSRSWSLVRPPYLGILPDWMLMAACRTGRTNTGLPRAGEAPRATAGKGRGDGSPPATPSRGPSVLRKCERASRTDRLRYASMPVQGAPVQIIQAWYYDAVRISMTSPYVQYCGATSAGSTSRWPPSTCAGPTGCHAGPAPATAVRCHGRGGRYQLFLECVIVGLRFKCFAHCSPSRSPLLPARSHKHHIRRGKKKRQTWTCPFLRPDRRGF